MICQDACEMRLGIFPREIEALAGSETMPTLLPGAAFFLGMNYPPARDMIRAGLGVALASDYNPGSSPSGNMRMVVSLASIRMRMTPAEAVNAATMNSAYAMGLSRDYGSITPGKVIGRSKTILRHTYVDFHPVYGCLEIGSKGLGCTTAIARQPGKIDFARNQRHSAYC